MRLFNFLVLYALLFLVSCSTTTDTSVQLNLDGTWRTNGLEETYVENITIFDGFLYAATDSGLYRTPTENPVAWTPVGLQEEHVLDVVFLPGNRWLAAIGIKDFSEGLTSLFLSEDNGETWQPHMGNYGGETGEYTWVEAIDTPNAPSNTVFARVTDRTVVRSTNGAENWELVNGHWSNLGQWAELVKVDPYHEKRVWASGVSAFGISYLLRSTDQGTSWKEVRDFRGICYDVVSHPEASNLVLAGCFNEPSIAKSTDGGDSWYDAYEEIATLTLANSKRNEETVYASGLNVNGTLFVSVSTNFGDRWQMVEWGESPTEIQANDMVSLMIGGQEVLYFGTDQGVYSYTFAE